MKKIILTLAIVVAGMAVQAQISYKGEDTNVNPPLLNKADSLKIEQEAKAANTSTTNPTANPTTITNDKSATPAATAPQAPLNNGGTKLGESGKSGMYIINDINNEDF